jgi:hypothetical protein
VVEEIFDHDSIGEMMKKKRLEVFVNVDGNLFFVFLQLQFSGALILGFNGLRIDCDFPLWMQYTLCGYMVSFLVRTMNQKRL